MRSFFGIAAPPAFLPAIIATPTKVNLKTVQKANGAKKPNSYIVTLKDGASRTPLVKKLKGLAKTTIYDKGLINGFAAEVDEEDLNILRVDPNVDRIEEDGIVTILGNQTNAPWGLHRISHQGKISAPLYTYQYSATGAGVDVYVVDTGINTAQTDFGGRAKWGATFGGYANADGNGHGTYCSVMIKLEAFDCAVLTGFFVGIVGGNQFGVAKEVSLVAVKVLSDAGSGSFSDIISGLNYIKAQATVTGRPSVVFMGLSGTTTLTTVDTAVASLTAAGIHIVVAAGDASQDVANVTPARAPSVITVTASNINDAFASFSNFGSGVDIIAPGVNIMSAASHVAGLVAYFISKEGNISPAAMANKLASYAISDAISGVPSGTVNRLAHNEF